MIPQQWVPPCGNQCNNKYSAFTQIPCIFHSQISIYSILSLWSYITIFCRVIVGRVFCKKGCSSEGDTWEECEIIFLVLLLLLLLFYFFSFKCYYSLKI